MRAPGTLPGRAIIFPPACVKSSRMTRYGAAATLLHTAHGRPVLIFPYCRARVSSIAIAVLSCVVFFAGCASWQGPRIDPTGERFLVWPNEPPPVVGPPVVGPPVVGPGVAPAAIAPALGAPIVGPPPAAPVVPLPIGNVQAPPVYSDPPEPPTAPAPAPAISIPPAPVIPGAAAPTLPPAAVAQAARIVGPGGVMPVAATVPYGRDYLRVTPDRLVAPVGSEILLKAGICGADGYLAANQRVDWSITRTGAGQFTEMGIRDPSQILGWWEAPQKIDEWSATSTTAFVPVSLNSRTPDPNDDVQINRGESWVTLTSATEGTSIVTAYAPAYSEFNQASAAIYWIDAQWIFPASTVVEAGRPHTLTTSVMRRTDGAPLAGWVVRYTVAGGASLGYEGGRSVDVPTDATGRASVEVSPMEAGGGTTNVGITIIRPESTGPNAMPRLELGRGAASIGWGAPAAPSASPPYATPAPALAPMPATPPPSLPGQTFAPSSPPTQPTPATTSPSAPTQPPPYTPPPNSSTGRPRLDVSLRATSQEQVAVGGYVSYELSITNRGDGVAKHVQIRDTFDKGLRHPAAQPNEFTVVNSNLRDLPPNESQTVPLTLQVVEPGEHWHDVVVSADGADPASQRRSVTGLQTTLEVKIRGPYSRVVGDVAEFNVNLRNVGTVAATKVELVIQFDPAIDPVLEQGMERLPNGSVLVRLDRDITPSEARVFRFQGRCQTQSTHACAHASVTALGGASSVDEACLEILPALPAAGPSATGTP